MQLIQLAELLLCASPSWPYSCCFYFLALSLDLVAILPKIADVSACLVVAGCVCVCLGVRVCVYLLGVCFVLLLFNVQGSHGSPL